SWPLCASAPRGRCLYHHRLLDALTGSENPAKEAAAGGRYLFFIYMRISPRQPILAAIDEFVPTPRGTCRERLRISSEIATTFNSGASGSPGAVRTAGSPSMWRRLYMRSNFARSRPLTGLQTSL